jgi:hypothetical protein
MAWDAPNYSPTVEHRQLLTFGEIGLIPGEQRRQIIWNDVDLAELLFGFARFQAAHPKVSVDAHRNSFK